MLNRRTALAFALPLIAAGSPRAETANAGTDAATNAAPNAAAMAAAGERSLLGSWTVDLRPTPGAPAYLKKLLITQVEGNRIEGSFYDGSPLQAGRINTTATPQLCFAFITDPGEGAYATSGRQVSPDRLEGMTLSTTRGFLLPWVAVRDPA